MLALLVAATLTVPSPLSGAERAFLAFRDADDRARLDPTASALRRRGVRAEAARAALSRVPAAGLTDEDRRAREAMVRALEPPAVGDALTRSVYEAYGRAAQSVTWNGETLDRGTILGRLAAEPDAARRKSLFLALTPVWTSMAGRPGEPSPYLALVAARRAAWASRPESEPFARKAAEWGLGEGQLEAWLVGVLEAWRAAAVDGPPVEPWDWSYENGAADRALAGRLPLDAMLSVAKTYYRDLGADPRRLHVALDIEPRPGKDPVAFTDFVRRGREAGGRWRDGRFRVSASYREGGLGNLYELMHELGHAAHIAAIRARPAFDDWPDSDVLTEALADVLGVEAYEPAWQAAYVGASAEPGEARRARLSGAVLDVAWALFEIRVHRDAGRDPNVLWTEITSRYLGIAPHPEWAWWAMRGQLVDSPGYMTNYALGAILTEAIRSRVLDLRGAGAFETPTPELYAWLSERLYRFGLARGSREVVEEFLGGSLTPEPLHRAIAAVRVAPESASSGWPRAGLRRLLWISDARSGKRVLGW